MPPALQRWEDAKNGLLSGKNRQKTVDNNDIMIGVASADVLPNLRNGKQLSNTNLDVEVFSPKIMRFGRKATSSTTNLKNINKQQQNVNKQQKRRRGGRHRHFRRKPKV